jgi:hypothetical protein
MPGFLPGDSFKEYRPKKDAVRANDLNEFNRRLRRLEHINVQWPLQLSNHPHNPVISLDDDYDGTNIGYYYNDGSFDCPSYGVLAVSGWHSQKIIKAKRPSSTFYTDYIVDAGDGCEIGKIGKFQRQEEKIVLYDSTATPAFDEWFGPKVDTFEAFKWFHTFKILGIEDSDLKLVRALYYPIHKIRGKTDGNAVGKGTNFDLSVYTGNDIAISGWDVSINNDYIDIPAEVLWAHAVLIAGQWELAGLECSAS